MKRQSSSRCTLSKEEQPEEQAHLQAGLKMSQTLCKADLKKSQTWA
jgi:hypothetical protein